MPVPSRAPRGRATPSFPFPLPLPTSSGLSTATPGRRGSLTLALNPAGRLSPLAAALQAESGRPGGGAQGREGARRGSGRGSERERVWRGVPGEAEEGARAGWRAAL